MIENTFDVIKQELNAFIDTDAKFSASTGSARPQAVNLLDLTVPGIGPIQEFIKFPAGGVTPILINIEEENQLRSATRFSQISSNGTRTSVMPDIRLNLYILFVCNYDKYSDSLRMLGLIIRYFQMHPVLDKYNISGGTIKLDDGIDRLIFELITLPFAEQNEVWNSLRAPYRPSLLYRVKMLVFQSQPSVMTPGEIKEVSIKNSDMS